MLADLAIGRTRAARKLADLSMALASGFTGHHALLCRLHRGPANVSCLSFPGSVAGRA